MVHLKHKTLAALLADKEEQHREELTTEQRQHAAMEHSSPRISRLQRDQRLGRWYAKGRTA